MNGTIKKTLVVKRGAKEDLPQLAVGELAFCTDTNEMFVGSLTGNVPVGGISENDMFEMMSQRFGSLSSDAFLSVYRPKKFFANIFVTEVDQDGIATDVAKALGLVDATTLQRIELPIGEWFTYEVDDLADDPDTSIVYVNGVQHIVSIAVEGFSNSPREIIVQCLDSNDDEVMPKIWVKQIIFK